MTRIPIGQLIKQFPAGTFNRLVDDLERRQKGQPPGNDGGPGAGAPPHGVFVRVVNETGAALEEYGIAKLDEPSFTAPTISGSDEADEATLANLTFDLAAATASDTDAPVVVTREPIADGEPGMAMVQGVTWARVEVSDAGHEYAAPTTSDSSKFTSTENATRFRILYKQSGTGTKWAVVEMGSGGTPADIIYARVNNTGGTSADTNLYAYDSGVSITGCVTAEATGQFRNNGQTIDDNQWVILVKRQDTGEYEPEQVGGEATGNVIYAQVNEGSGVTSASGTFSFDNAIAVVGTSPGTGTATNVHSQKYANNEWLLLFQRKSDNAWVTGRRPSAIFTGTAYAGFAEGDANLQVANLTAIWGEAPTTTPLTVANTLKLTGATGDDVLVVENDDGNYLAVNCEHRIIEWLKDQSGYDAGETQYFRHVSGTPGWAAGPDIVLFFCTPSSNVTGNSSFTGGSITQVLGTAPSGPTETIKNTLGWYVDAGSKVLCVEDYLGEYEAVAVQDYAPAWLRAQSGYNGSNNQVFHHDAGTFKWGDYGTCS